MYFKLLITATVFNFLHFLHPEPCDEADEETGSDNIEVVDIDHVARAEACHELGGGVVHHNAGAV